ncbi:MAG: CARDB domain-containing protein, partial [Candidatus Hodarchaeales archaeon]
MRLRQISILLQLFLINMLLMLGSASTSTFAVETDSVAQDFSAITDESASDRKSPNILVDNVYYDEELMIEIWRDGSEKSVWKLEDSGNNLLAFPTTLPTPLNSSYPGVQDMRIDLLVSEVPQLSAEGGLMADFDQFADDYDSSNSEGAGDYGDADYASFSSNEVLVTFRVWNETVNNSGILYDGLNDSQKLIKDTINDLSLALGTTFHLMTNRSGIYWDMQNDYGIEQSWRAFLFDLNDAWNTLFSVLPLGEGLTKANTSRLMQADARSLYLVSEWDEKPDRDWSTDVDGSGQDEEDDRWEFEAMFGILEKEKLALNASSNQLFFNDLMDFDQIQYSHLKANASSITVRLPYGSRIDNIEPYDSRNINGICYFGLDLVGYHTRRVIEYDSVTFTLDALPMPSLLLHATTNATVVSPNDIVQIDYNLTNIGNAPAYNAFLWGFDNDSGPETEWNFINVTQGNFNYTYWDPASDRAYFNFGQIDAGESVVHSVILNATPPGNLWNRTFTSDSWVDYSGDPTTGTPTGWIQTAIRNWGNDLGFWYNHSDAGPELNVKVQLANSDVAVGENFTISAKVTNTGNKTAYSIDWWAPYQLNITNRNGIIESLAPGASVIVNTTYLVDAASRYITDSTRDEAPTRQLGSTFDFYETGRSDLGGGYDYSGWFINQYDDNATTFTSNIWGSEIKLDVLPASNQTLGPFLTVNVQHSADTIPSGEKTTVSITVANVGSTAAENVVVNSEFSDSEFAFYAGAGTISGGQGSAQARRFTYNWGTLAPGDSLSFSYRLEAQKNATIYTHTYAVVDWDAFTGFGGLTRTFYPRTYDWEDPTIAGPADLEIFKNKTAAITDNLTWSLSDEHS